MSNITKATERIEAAFANNSNTLDFSYLRLTNDELKELLPQIKEKIPNLETLNLRSNRLTTMPDWVTGFKNLKELNVNYNHLEHLDLNVLEKMANQGLQTFTAYINWDEIIIPEDLTKQLRHNTVQSRIRTAKNNKSDSLDISNLGLTSDNLKALLPQIKEELPNLKKLNLSENQLTTIPQEMIQFKELEELDISKNPLESLGTTILKELTNQKLCTLKSYSNFKVVIQEDVKKQLRHNTVQSRIQTAKNNKSDSLDISNLELTSADLKELLTHIQQIPNLKKLNLSHNKLTTIPQELTTLITLQELDISNNQLEDFDTNILKELADQGLGNPKLDHNLNWIIIQEDLKKQLNLNKANLIIQDAEANNSDCLDLGSLGLTNEDFKKLLPQIKEKLPNLKTFFLYLNDINVKPQEITGFTKLQAIHPSNLPPNITKQLNLNKATSRIQTAIKEDSDSLDISNLGLTNDDLNKLLLDTNKIPNLKKLYLKGNQLTSLSQEIKKLKELEELDISNNPLESLDTTILEELANQKLCTLESRKTPNVDIPEELTKQLRRNTVKSRIATAINNKSDSLDISNLGLTNDDLKELLPDIQKKTNLKRFDLKGNSLIAMPHEATELITQQKPNVDNNPLPKFDTLILQKLANQGLGISDIDSEMLVFIPEDLTKQLRHNTVQSRIQTTIEKGRDYLNISDLGLTNDDLQELLLDIQQIPNLKKLNLKKNQLTTIPQWIKGLTKLERLDISKNPLESLDTTILEELANQKLYILQFSNNFKKVISKDFKKQLRHNTVKSRIDTTVEKYRDYLDISNLGLTNDDVKELLPQIKEKLPNLKTLNLSENQFTTIPQEIIQFKKLEELEVNKGLIEHIPQNVKKQIGFNKAKSQIEHAVMYNSDSLYLSNLELTTADLQVLLFEIKKKIPNLRELDISKNKVENFESQILQELANQGLGIINVDSNVKKTMPAGLKKQLLYNEINYRIEEEVLNNINYLDFSNLELTTADLEVFIPDIKDKIPNLEILNLEGNKLTTIPQDITTSLNKLKKLKLYNNFLSSQRIHELENTVKHIEGFGLEYSSEKDLKHVDLLTKLFKNEDKFKEITEKIYNLDEEKYVVKYDENKGTPKTGREVLIEFLKNVPDDKAGIQEVYDKTVKHLLDQIKGATSDKTDLILGKISISLGNCKTPVNNFILQEAVILSQSHPEIISSEEIDLILEREALEMKILQANIIRQRKDPQEQMQGLLNAVYLDNTNKYPQVFYIRARGKTLPSKTKYIGLAFGSITRNQARKFVALFCKKRRLINLFMILFKIPFTVDPKKIYRIKDEYLGRLGVISDVKKEILSFEAKRDALMKKQEFSYLTIYEFDNKLVKGFYDGFKKQEDALRDALYAKQAKGNQGDLSGVENKHFKKLEEKLKRLTRKIPKPEEPKELQGQIDSDQINKLSFTSHKENSKVEQSPKIITNSYRNSLTM